MTDTKTNCAVALNMHAATLANLSSTNIGTMTPMQQQLLFDLLAGLGRAIRSIAEDIDKLEDAG